MRLLEASLLIIAALPLATPASGLDLNRLRLVEQGRALLQEHRCNGSCHQGLSDENDALAFYTRANRKANNMSQLERAVKLCVEASQAAVFPEDVASIALALEHDHYKFK